MWHEVNQLDHGDVVWWKGRPAQGGEDAIEGRYLTIGLANVNTATDEAVIQEVNGNTVVCLPEDLAYEAPDAVTAF
jgi:hypothetical protein